MSMRQRKWLVALGIIAILAAEFYWGGSDQPPKGSDATSVAPAGAVEQTPAADVAEASSNAGADAGAAADAATPEQQPAVQAPAVSQSAAGDVQQHDSPDKTADSKQPLQSTQPSEQKQPTKPAAVADSQTKGAGNEGSPSTSSPSANKPVSSKPASSKSSSNQPASDAPSTSSPAVVSKPPAKSVEKGTTTGKKEPYLTDKVPAGKPAPVEWQDAKVDKKQPLTVTLSVSCKTILDQLDKFNSDKLEVLPEDGVIFAEQKVSFYEGESVFDVLLREMKKHKIHMEFEMTPLYNSNYVEGIHNIYEFDCGELSGWMYRVNGWFPNYGASRYKLGDGDVIEWLYTCDLGRDLGGAQTTAGGDR
ncbi:DUF4430 domain-containing protein [Paenibacillus sp. OV219]|uniref:DUF4430 domain-containing protein n=1 Tax=Paenibacillus sp. OV219 TaxID=1884377 RepID=UPI0008C82122|nr:DUF4430 domain-containing protein [Paenibacillus sp. OV219]SEM51809.1 protein of unknown function [Paenibacillus sp. OV219]